MIGISLLLTMASVFTPVADSNGTGIQAATPLNKTLLLQLVNNVRKKGCQCGDTYYPSAPALTWNDKLEKAAMIHSADMAQKNYFSHTSQDGSKAGQRIEAAGYRWMAYGENIAMGYSNEAEVIKGWVGSVGHCKNIMTKNYTDMGVARVGSYWTQEFATK